MSKRRSSRRRGQTGRSTRRQAGHDAAQAMAEEMPPDRVPDHPLIPDNNPVPITTEAELHELVEHVRAVGSFAYDTEFIGEETYHPRICLIQIGTSDRVALVDPLPADGRAPLDLTPVWDLITDPDVETIVHAGAQDLEPAARHLKRAPARIFDTQIVAGFAGRPYPLGLRRLVEELVGARLGKALTFTQWDRRPLSAVHARYASDDVRYLPAARETLRADLETLGHTVWAEEECAKLASLDQYRFDPDARVKKLLGNRSFKPKTVSVLRALIMLRDRVARDENLPPRTVLKDDVVVRLAKEHARSVDRLASVKGLPRPFVDRYGAEVIEVTAHAMELPPPKRGTYALPDETPLDTVQIDSLWAMVSTYCLGRGVAPALVGNRRVVAEFHFRHRGAALLGSGPLASGWRHELVGEIVEQVLAGKRTMRVSWANGRMEADTL